MHLLRLSSLRWLRKRRCSHSGQHGRGGATKEAGAPQPLAGAPGAAADRRKHTRMAGEDTASQRRQHASKRQPRVQRFVQGEQGARRPRQAGGQEAGCKNGCCSSGGRASRQQASSAASTTCKVSRRQAEAGAGGRGAAGGQARPQVRTCKGEQIRPGQAGCRACSRLAGGLRGQQGPQTVCQGAQVGFAGSEGCWPVPRR